MLGFNRKKKKEKKLDKLVMGAIIGGAIGSVLGLSLAPKKGKETRKFIGDKIKKKKKKISEKDDSNVNKKLPLE